MAKANEEILIIKVELGHRADFKSKILPNGFTHDWTVFVRGRDGADIHHFVEKVVFKLHATFKNPRREIFEPPYEVSESGYAGFVMNIELIFRNKTPSNRKIVFEYDLFLNGPGAPPVNNCRLEKIKFRNPTEDFKQKLLKAGAWALKPQAPPSPCPITKQRKEPSSSLVATTTYWRKAISTASSNCNILYDDFENVHTFTNSMMPRVSKDMQTNILESSAAVAMASAGSAMAQPFTDLFGPPIRTSTALDSPKNKTKHKDKDRDKGGKGKPSPPERGGDSSAAVVRQSQQGYKDISNSSSSAPSKDTSSHRDSKDSSTSHKDSASAMEKKDKEVDRHSSSSRQDRDLSTSSSSSRKPSTSSYSHKEGKDRKHSSSVSKESSSKEHGSSSSMPKSSSSKSTGKDASGSGKSSSKDVSESSGKDSLVSSKISVREVSESSGKDSLSGKVTSKESSEGASKDSVGKGSSRDGSDAKDTLSGKSLSKDSKKSSKEYTKSHKDKERSIKEKEVHRHSSSHAPSEEVLVNRRKKEEEESSSKRHKSSKSDRPHSSEHSSSKSSHKQSSSHKHHKKDDSKPDTPKTHGDWDHKQSALSKPSKEKYLSFGQGHKSEAETSFSAKKIQRSASIGSSSSDVSDVSSLKFTDEEELKGRDCDSLMQEMSNDIENRKSQKKSQSKSKVKITTPPTVSQSPAAKSSHHSNSTKTVSTSVSVSVKKRHSSSSKGKEADKDSPVISSKPKEKDTKRKSEKTETGTKQSAQKRKSATQEPSPSVKQRKVAAHEKSPDPEPKPPASSAIPVTPTPRLKHHIATKPAPVHKDTSEEEDGEISSSSISESDSEDDNKKFDQTTDTQPNDIPPSEHDEEEEGEEEEEEEDSVVPPPSPEAELLRGMHEADARMFYPWDRASNGFMLGDLMAIHNKIDSINNPDLMTNILDLVFAAGALRKKGNTYLFDICGLDRDYVEELVDLIREVSDLELQEY